MAEIRADDERRRDASRERDNDVFTRRVIGYSILLTAVVFAFAVGLNLVARAM